MEDKPLIVGGKSYISSKRAAQVFGYTNDYIGQLSRSKKISSIMVGRDRFVDYSSVSNYADQAKQVTPIQAPKPVVPEAPLKSDTPRVDPRQVFAGAVTVVGLLLFFAATPLGRNALNNIIISVSRHEEIATEIKNEALALDSSASAVSSVVSFGKQSDSVYLGYLHNIDQGIVSVWSVIRGKVLALIAPLFDTPVSETKVVVGSATTTTSSVTVSSNAPGIQTGLSAEEVRAIVKEVAGQEIAKTIDYTSQASTRNAGVVTVPSTGSAQGDAAITQIVKNSFSDQVNVTLDASRSSGIIMPVFRNPTDDEYLFVVVPVKHAP